MKMFNKFDSPMNNLKKIILKDLKISTKII